MKLVHQSVSLLVVLLVVSEFGASGSESDGGSCTGESCAITTDDEVQMLQLNLNTASRSHKTNKERSLADDVGAGRDVQYATLDGDCLGKTVQTLEYKNSTQCALACTRLDSKCAGFSVRDGLCVLSDSTCDVPIANNKWKFSEKRAYDVYEGYGCVQHWKHEFYDRFYYWEGYTRAGCQYLCDQDPQCISFTHKGGAGEQNGTDKHPTAGACYGSSQCHQIEMQHFGAPWNLYVKKSSSAYPFHCFAGPHGRCYQCEQPAQDPCPNWSTTVNPEFSADMLGFGRYCASWEVNDGEFLGGSGHCPREGHLGAAAVMVPGGIV